ncbi:DUF6644 family protein [Thalassospira sp.]|uniref:DUF6644 family protein n=1 Tax=Thalassospira sp. TaxID=1912094 RepID=UPI000C489F72|nr:DUF6644 family protein [Thalassospira sp.]MBC06131.1 hypothetical protein [Thalassospira sp.]|tara:strand:- start:24466 stop:24960 length:495 start_codon:yes stop_codon:yes gene_type:complete
MSDWLLEAARTLEATDFAIAIRMVPWLYPVLETVHLIGISLLFGSIIALDLRILGVARTSLPFEAIMRFLVPFAWVGFACAALSGLTMFIGIASTITQSAATPWKFALIGVAGINMLIFHADKKRQRLTGTALKAPTLPQKLSALASILLWLGVIFAGRMIAYV